MGPQRISERLEAVLLINGNHPNSRRIKTWHFFHGSNIIAIASLFIALTSFGFSCYYEQESKQLLTNNFL